MARWRAKGPLRSMSEDGAQDELNQVRLPGLVPAVDEVHVRKLHREVGKGANTLDGQFLDSYRHHLPP